jgi:hypothetical protein
MLSWPALHWDEVVPKAVILRARTTRHQATGAGTNFA